MDALAALRLYQTEKATFEVSADFDLGGDQTRTVKLRFRVPTADENDRLMSQCTISGEGWRNYAAMRGVFLPALIVGWSGIRITDFVEEGDDEWLPFMPQWIEVVLTKFASLRDRAFAELMDRHKAQEEKAAREKKT